MNVITVCVPSARLHTHITRALRRAGHVAKAFDAPPSLRAHRVVVEHLPCPIEPAKPTYLWIALPAGMKAHEFLEATFLNEQFVKGLVAKLTDGDDLLTIECVVAAAVAREMAQSYSGGANATRRLYQFVEKEGSNPTHRRIAEDVLSIPSWLDLLQEFAERLIQGSSAASRRAPALA